jgi:hypothetical protein
MLKQPHCKALELIGNGDVLQTGFCRGSGAQLDSEGCGTIMSSRSDSELEALPIKEENARQVARRDLIASGDVGSIRNYLSRWCNSTQRPHAFLDLVAAMLDPADPTFWRLLTEHWSGFDVIPHAAYAAAFRLRRAAWLPACMGSAASVSYDQLPPIVVLYRGQSLETVVGLSWSLSHEVAAGFAKGHRGIPVPSPAVFTTRVRKSSIAFICTERSEAEAVLFRPPRGIHLADAQVATG